MCFNYSSRDYNIVHLVRRRGSREWRILSGQVIVEVELVLSDWSSQKSFQLVTLRRRLPKVFTTEIFITRYPLRVKIDTFSLFPFQTKSRPVRARFLTMSWSSWIISITLDWYSSHWFANPISNLRHVSAVGDDQSNIRLANRNNRHLSVWQFAWKASTCNILQCSEGMSINIILYSR